MFSVVRCDLPGNSLLSKYRDNGVYTDCYTTIVDKNISQVDYIQAFYTTVPFRIERTILRWAISKPSTDEDVRLLAEAKAETFAAWNVEARGDDQILLSDYRGRTRSWLMSETSSSNDGNSTRLYFGSAVVPIRVRQTEGRRKRNAFSVLLRFHKLYSQVLLSSAKSQLSSANSP